ncbi:MAG TPA: cupin domain-containing protein [Rhizomicrobium sp.]|nr:cupin domain-containing protein [Rhizomicrobium sp.]
MTFDDVRCIWREVTCAYAAHALAADEIAAAEAHIASCPGCRHELETVRPVIDSLVSWPAYLLRPGPSLQVRLAERIAGKTGAPPQMPSAHPWSEPEWEQVAPGIECKLLATDAEKERVSMLVRLAPGTSYPAHTHAGMEELHLLNGELWIDRRKLFPGEYHHAAPGSDDIDVHSETGCTCLLVTSPSDILK